MIKFTKVSGDHMVVHRVAVLNYEYPQFEEIRKKHHNYSSEKKRNSKISPLSSPFNALLLIVINYLFVIKSYLNSSVA